jgi:hypothetical protein
MEDKTEVVTEQSVREPSNQTLLVMINKLDEKVGLLIAAQKDGVKTAMDAAEKAVAKAEIAADKRFEGLNELRNMASDWRTEFARQATVDLQIKGLMDKMDALRGSLWAYLIGGVTAGAAVATLVVALLRRTA